MAPKKHYVVYKGREIGIFTNWWDCHKSINGFPGNSFQSFPCREQAENAWLSFQFKENRVGTSHALPEVVKQNPDHNIPSSSHEQHFDPPFPPPLPPARWLIRK